jgi:cysteine synthase A
MQEMKVADNVLELIGSTPIVKLNKTTKGIKATVLAKLEFLNPSGSIKDRIAKHMIESAERKGILKPDSVIAVATTGNTGIAFAMVAAIKGYKTIVVMPNEMSGERKKMISAYGAEIVFTPGCESGVDKSIKKVEEMASKNPKIWVADQFANIENVVAHRETTAREILAQTKGKVDAFVAGVGTGGTIIGVAELLKQEIPNVRIVAVEPDECAVLSGGKKGPHRIEGIGDGFIPNILRLDLIDEVIAVPDEEAIKMARRLAREEGIFAGISSGANVFAALRVAGSLDEGKVVVTVLPDSGQRYFSTDLYRMEEAKLF